MDAYWQVGMAHRVFVGFPEGATATQPILLFVKHVPIVPLKPILPENMSQNALEPLQLIGEPMVFVGEPMVLVGTPMF